MNIIIGCVGVPGTNGGGKITLSLCALTSLYFICIIFVRKYIKTRWEQVVFYGIMGYALSITLLLGVISHGETIKTMLYVDPNDTLMDFFNSIQYGMKPYENGVIYPPLINVIYGLLGKFALIPGGDVHILRETQMGALVFGFYTLVVYFAFGYFIFKVKKGFDAERVLFLGLLITSLPFVFAYERGNSVIIAIVALLVYLNYYKNVQLKMRVVSYCALGIAAGIKITPILFGTLIIRTKKIKDIALALVVCMVIFFAPFLLTDGNIFSLVNNILNTENMMGVVNRNGIMQSIGEGVFVNITSFFTSLTKITNINLYNIANILSLLIGSLSVTVLLIMKNIEEWKQYALLCGVLVLCPGFSAVYNLTYFIIPLIWFLNAKPQYDKLNVLFLLLMIGIFIPMFNIPMEVFGPTEDDYCPMVMSTFIESVCTIILVVSVLLISIFEKTKNKERFLCGSIAFISVFLGINGVIANKAVNAYYQENLAIVNSGRGFSLYRGKYIGFEGEEAELLLNNNEVYTNGLIIKFGNGLSQNNISEKIGIYINERKVKLVDLNAENFVYIPAKELEQFKGEVKIKLSREGENKDYIPLTYIGPAKKEDNINNMTAIEYFTDGLIKSGGYNALYKNVAKFTFDKEKIENGLLADFYIPKSIMAFYGHQIPIDVFVNKIYIKTIILNDLDNSVVVLDSNDIKKALNERFKDDMVVCVEMHIPNYDECVDSDNISTIKNNRIRVLGMRSYTDISNYKNYKFKKNATIFISKSDYVNVETLDIVLEFDNYVDHILSIDVDDNCLINKYIDYYTDCQEISIPSALLQENKIHKIKIYDHNESSCASEGAVIIKNIGYDILKEKL